MLEVFFVRGLDRLRLAKPLINYLIESRRAESLIMVELESPFIIVELESLFIIEVESVIEVEVSVVSVLVLEQAEAKAIIARTKNADFTMSTISLS